MIQQDKKGIFFIIKIEFKIYYYLILRFRTVTASFYRGTHGVLLTFDLTNKGR